MRGKPCQLAMVLCALLFFVPVGYVAPGMMSYQGRLTNAAGTPVTGTLSMTFRLYDDASGGNLLWEESHPGVTPVLEITGGADLSERFDVRPERDCLPAPGMLVSIDAQRPGGLSISKEAYDRKIAGIISGAGGINPGMLMGQKGTKADGASPVALNGRVYCWADASTGPIEPGDLLTSSDTHGHAMRASDCTKARGAILGKAMSRLKTGRGLVLVLVTLQ